MRTYYKEKTGQSKCVLILAYECAPYNRPGSTIGAQRPFQFAKYLPKFGWQALVLCCDFSQRYSLSPKSNWKETIKKIVIEKLEKWDKKESLIISLPSLEYADFVDRVWLNSIIMDKNKGTFSAKPNLEFKIQRKITTFLKLFRGDHSQSWQKVALFASETIFKYKTNITIQIAEHGPDGSLFVARKLFKKYKVPWIVDFRDPIFQPYHYFSIFWMKKFLPLFLTSISATINVNKHWSKADQRNFKKPSYTISNGFDKEEFLYLKKKTSDSDKIVFFYPGNVYPPRQKTEYFFVFLSRLKQKNIDFEFIYCGNACKHIKELCQKHEVLQYSKIFPNVSREEVFKWYSIVTFLVIFPLMDAHDPYYFDGFLPGKFLEYLGAKKPIFCISPYNSQLERTIKKIQCGLIFYSPTEAANWFTYENWKTKIPKVILNERSQYSRENLTKKLAVILDNYCKKKI